MKTLSVRKTIAVFFFVAQCLGFVSCAAGKPDLIVHYYRYDGDYAGWNVWAWPVDPYRRRHRGLL